MKTGLNILFLTPRFPYPLIGGDRLKPYMVLKHLAKEHNVHLVTFNQGGYPSVVQTDAIRALGVEVHPIPLDAIKSGIRSLFLTLFTVQPLEIAYYNQPEYAIKVQELIKRNNYDLIVSFFMRTAEYVKDIQINKILMAEDCRTLYQKRSYIQSKNNIQRIVRWWEVKKLEKYEPAIMKYFDRITFVTTQDIEQMKSIYPEGNYKLLTNGTDIGKFEPPVNDSQREGVLFAGKLDIWANVLMINRIVNNIMPLVWESNPQVTLTIAGANPSRKILSMANARIKIEANVKEMVPYLQKAAVFIHPHDGGSGIQNKLIEAMACGCPVVTTDTGSQGLPAVDGENIFLRNSDEDMANCILNLIEDKQLAARIGHNAHIAISNNLSWDTVYSQMDEIISELT